MAGAKEEDEPAVGNALGADFGGLFNVVELRIANLLEELDGFIKVS